jgi:hypothetical protein
MRNREQDEAALTLGGLAGTVDRVREMLGRLAQPQRGQVAGAVLPSIMSTQRAIGRLLADVLKYTSEE